MKRFIGLSLALASVILAVPTPAQLAAARHGLRNRAGDPLRIGAELPEVPPNLYLGEGIGVARNSKGHIFVYTRSQDTRLFEFDQKGTFVREIGEGLYGFAFAHAVRVDPQDNIWAVDEGTNMVDQVQPRGPRGDGPGPPAGSRRRAMPDTGRRPPPRRALRLQPADRCCLGCGRQHLRLRRLRQLARREVRQERALRQVRRNPRLRAGAAQSSAHHRGRRQGQRLRRRPEQPPHSGLRQRSGPSRRSTTRSARPGRSASRPGRINICTARIRIPTTTTPRSRP